MPMYSARSRRRFEKIQDGSGARVVRRLRWSLRSPEYLLDKRSASMTSPDQARNTGSLRPSWGLTFQQALLRTKSFPYIHYDSATTTETLLRHTFSLGSAPWKASCQTFYLAPTLTHLNKNDEKITSRLQGSHFAMVLAPSQITPVHISAHISAYSCTFVHIRAHQCTLVRITHDSRKQDMS